ncbi:GTP-binding protein [Tabrizicola sp.]|uniref:CobW family GTP-binding protein n=1 Tax=Tabrizicola sp. TaxID=2005166 RepID=UPI0035B2E030
MAEVRPDGRLPLTIVGGFLGAGKSSWLRHQLYTRRFGRVHVLVNEAAELPVDDLLLGRADRLEVLAGGCACCTGRAALIAALRRICDDATGAGAGAIDALVLETSGLADPAAIARALQDDPVLVRRIVLARTIVLVDAGAAMDQLAGEPLARRQIEAADEIVVTKAAGTDLPQRSRLAATLRLLAPGAAVSWAEFGVEAPQEIDPAAAPFDLPEPEAATPILAHRLDARDAGGWWALSAWLSALLHARGDRIVRIKGVITTPAGRLLLQSVRHHVQAPEILPEAPPGAGDPDFIVLIGRDIDEQRLLRSWDIFVRALQATRTGD